VPLTPSEFECGVYFSVLALLPPSCSRLFCSPDTCFLSWLFLAASFNLFFFCSPPLRGTTYLLFFLPFFLGRLLLGRFEKRAISFSASVRSWNSRLVRHFFLLSTEEIPGPFFGLRLIYVKTYRSFLFLTSPHPGPLVVVVCRTPPWHLRNPSSNVSLAKSCRSPLSPLPRTFLAISL